MKRRVTPIEVTRQVDAQLEAAGAGLDELARAQVTEALRPALEGLTAFKHALRAQLGARGLGSMRGVPEAPASPSPESRESRGPRSITPNNNKSRTRGPR